MVIYRRRQVLPTSEALVVTWWTPWTFCSPEKNKFFLGEQVLFSTFSTLVTCSHLWLALGPSLAHPTYSRLQTFPETVLWSMLRLSERGSPWQELKSGHRLSCVTCLKLIPSTLSMDHLGLARDSKLSSVHGAETFKRDSARGSDKLSVGGFSWLRTSYQETFHMWDG